MNTTSILVKLDPQIKMQAQKTAKEMGISLTSVINRYLKYFVKTKKITFTSHEEKPSKYLVNAMKQAKKDLKTGKASPTFNNVDDAIKWLNK